MHSDHDDDDDDGDYNDDNKSDRGCYFKKNECSDKN